MVDGDFSGSRRYLKTGEVIERNAELLLIERHEVTFIPLTYVTPIDCFGLLVCRRYDVVCPLAEHSFKHDFFPNGYRFTGTSAPVQDLIAVIVCEELGLFGVGIRQE